MDTIGLPEILGMFGGKKSPSLKLVDIPWLKAEEEPDEIRNEIDLIVTSVLVWLFVK